MRTDLRPWEPQSDFAEMAGQLKWWEHGLPGEHTWNPSLMRGYRSVGQDVVSLEFPLAEATRLTYRRHTWR